MADIAEASDVLGQLADLGVRIAVDDYGTGYSSLAYLHRLPANELKLDRSFVANVAADQSNSIIVRSSIAMAHSLGLSVVAEGAEDEVTCAILADAGCDAVQGYYFSPPLGREDLLRWFATHPRLRFSREMPSSRPLRVIPGRLEDTQAGRQDRELPAQRLSSLLRNRSRHDAGRESPSSEVRLTRAQSIPATRGVDGRRSVEVPLAGSLTACLV